MPMKKYVQDKYITTQFFMYVLKYAQFPWLHVCAFTASFPHSSSSFFFKLVSVLLKSNSQSKHSFEVPHNLKKRKSGQKSASLLEMG